MPKNPTTFGLVLVGDELLSGRRKDLHFEFLVNTLAQRGGQLAWVRMIGDDVDAQSQTYRQTLASSSVVFSFGGIGATPDDLTRQAAAYAFERELVFHPEGMQIMQVRFGKDFNQRRRQLINFPEGADLIPNPINQVPGFSLLRHHFVPGFPNMAHPMVEWVLDKYYHTVFNTAPKITQSLRTEGVHESDLIPIMEKVLSVHPNIKLSSLPQTKNIGLIELGITAETPATEAAFSHLCQLLEQAEIAYHTLS